MGVHIEGIEQARTTLELYPIKIDKVVKDSMRQAAKAAAQVMRPKMPNKTFRKAVKYTVKKGKEYFFANVGILRSKKEKVKILPNGKKDVTIWSKAYFKNYGTLANRDPGHKFTYARKSVYRDRKGGIKPAHFFERTMNGAEEVMQKKFEEHFLATVKKQGLADAQK